MDYLEKCIGEASDKHDSHKVTMEGRLKYLETLIGDNADKHLKEIKDAKSQLGNLDNTLKNCAKVEHAASIEQRMEYLEQCIGESADKHDNHKVSMEGRLKYIEKLIGDNADKHAKQVEAAQAKLGNLDDALKACAKVDNHVELEKRLGGMEGLLNDTAAGNKAIDIIVRQIHEQWDREDQKRNVHQEHTKDLVTREGLLRDAVIKALETRMRQLEGIVSQETTRLWMGMDKSIEDIRKQVSVQKMPQMVPQFAQPPVFTQLMQEPAAMMPTTGAPSGYPLFNVSAVSTAQASEQNFSVVQATPQSPIPSGRMPMVGTPQFNGFSAPPGATLSWAGFA
jgi:hypothetical protein